MRALRNESSPVLEVLFPQVRARLFGTLLKRPIRPRYVRELAAISGLALHTIQDELRKLSVLGIVKTWSNGYHRFYAANQSHPFFQHLVALVEASGQLPRSRNAALKRRSQANKRKRRKRQHIPPDRQPRWGLFERRRRTRRL